MLPPITNLKDNLISASPFLVSVPFTVGGLSKFDGNEEQALWQPPGYVFGIVWPTLYVLLFMMINDDVCVCNFFCFLLSLCIMYMYNKLKKKIFFYINN